MKTVLMKKKIICESSDDSDFFSDDYSEESLDKYFEEMGAIGKDSNSKYSEIAILRSFILKHNFSKNAKKHLTKLVKCLSKNNPPPPSDIIRYSSIFWDSKIQYISLLWKMWLCLFTNKFQQVSVQNC